MSGKKESARAALARVHSLHSDFHEPILAELDREGLLDRPTKDSIVRASTADSRVAKIEAALTDPNRAPAIKYALGELRRLGVSMRMLLGRQIAE